MDDGIVHSSTTQTRQKQKQNQKREREKRKNKSIFTLNDETMPLYVMILTVI